jgi:hypothetical protein
MTIIHPPQEAESKMNSTSIPCPVTKERSAVLELLSGKDQAHLVKRDSLLVLDLLHQILNRV